MYKLDGSIEITTVIGCKVGCKGCHQLRLTNKYPKESSRTFSVNDFKKCIDKIPKMVKVIFSGMAEPWLNIDCTEMLLYAAKRGHVVSVRTTLFGMKANDLDKIKDVEMIDELTIQLPDDSGDSNIQVTEGYISIIKSVLDWPNKLSNKLKFICHGTVHPVLAKLVKVDDPSSDIKPSDTCEGRICCSISGRAINRNVLLPDGTVLLCYMDFELRHILGNLLKVSYDELFIGPEALRIIKGFDDCAIELLCRRCPLARQYN